MRDILPDEMRMRDEIMEKMKQIYWSFGFDQIETPCMERIENLQSNQGGDNEKLVFRIMKRGEKLLSVPADSSLDELADKPQQGRYRQFYQADIDIIGDDSVNAESPWCARKG